MQMIPVFDRYSIQMSRSRMIGHLALFAALFGLGCGLGIGAVSVWTLRGIIQQSASNMATVAAIRAEASEVEKQAGIVASRCGVSLHEVGL